MAADQPPILVLTSASHFQPLVHLTAHLSGDERQSLFTCCKVLADAARHPMVMAQQVLHRADTSDPPQKPTVLSLLNTRTVPGWTDDQLYQAIGLLLKHGADVSTCQPGANRKGTCGSGESAKENGNGTDIKATHHQHEVAWLTQRAATRTLALLIKQRPKCSELIKAYETLRAGVLSNKEFTLLFLTARGANFRPHLDGLIEEAVRHGASKSLLWLFQWHEDMTPDKLRAHLQSALPDPDSTSCADVAAGLEVLLLHGLSANCTVTCTKRGTQPTADDPGTEHSLLEWAVLHATAAAQVHEAKLTAARSAAATPPASPLRLESQGRTGVTRRSGSVPDFADLSAVSTPTSSGAATSRASASEGGAAAGYYGPELLRVVLARGAAVNARKGGALLLAAQALRSELVSELVAGGADVTVPRHPSGCDLLRWAVDTRACPPDTGVLQALLAAVKSQALNPAGPEAGASGSPRMPSPKSHDNLCTVRDKANRTGKASNGGDVLAPATPAANCATGNAKSGKHGVAASALASAAAATSATKPLSPSLTVMTTACGPMVTMGGQTALTRQAEEACAEEQKAMSSSAGKGSLLPSTLRSELQRDAAFLEAVARNDLKVVQCLVEAGADVHSRQDKAILLALGAIDNENPDNWMPRPRDRAATLSMSRPMVDLLLAHGADINARQGRALCQAGRWKDTSGINYLLALGADRTWLDKDPVVQQRLKA